MDKRGVLRGRCSVEGCSCDKFEVQERSSSCAECGHKPVKHRLAQKNPVTHSSSVSVPEEKPRLFQPVHLPLQSQKANVISSDLEREDVVPPTSSYVPTEIPTGVSSEAITVEDCEYNSDGFESAEETFHTSHFLRVEGPSSPTTDHVNIHGLSLVQSSVSGNNLCSLDNCRNPRYKDENGFTHECCSLSHAMEYQRRKAVMNAPVVKGITHCLLPYCNAIVWPFMNYCGKTHANIGMSMNLQPPLPVVSADQDQTAPQLLTPKDDNMCLLPQCRRERYKEPDGKLHPFCGRSHAKLAREMNIEVKLPEEEECIIPECHRRRYKDGTVQHPYCSKRHAKEGKQRGIFPVAENTEDQCEFEGCTCPKFEENGIKYQHCSKNHAINDMSEQKILKSRSNVESWLKTFNNLRVVNLTENVAAKTGGELFRRFREAYKGLPQNQRKTALGFHGTPEENISSICSNGFDPGRRHGQRYGPGEYFATTPDISMGYSRDCKKMLVCELLLGQYNKHHTQQDNIIVMKNPDHDLPRFILEFR